MKVKTTEIFLSLLARYPTLEACGDDILATVSTLSTCYASSGQLLVCGNGGSSADADHMVGELMKQFLIRRPLPAAARAQLQSLFPNHAEYLVSHLQGALPTLSLGSSSALISAFSNDVADDMAFAQQVYGYGHKADVFLGISTSGNAKNVLNAAMVAKAMGLGTIALTGSSGGALRTVCDRSICVPENETFKVQELHLPVYHCICAMLESEFWSPEE